MKNLYQQAVTEQKFRGIFKGEKTENTKLIEVSKEEAEEAANSFLSRFGLDSQAIKDAWTLLFGDLDEVMDLLDGETTDDTESSEKSEEKNNINNEISKIKNLNEQINKKVVLAAKNFVVKKDNLNAEHCTDWVSKVYGSMGLIPDANAGKIFFNGNLNKRNGKLYPEKIAGKEVVKQIPIGCNIVIENGNKYTNTHEAIVTKNFGDGRLEVASFPGGKAPPKIEIYNFVSGLDPKVNKTTSNGERVGNLCRAKLPPSKKS